MSRKTPSIEHCKRDASLLLKDLRRSTTALKAANRFQRLAPFKNLSHQEIAAQADSVQRKHALDVIAREHGFLNWAKLVVSSDNLWYRGGAFSNIWCKSHAEAQRFQQETGGYILTDRGKCFVADRYFIEFLGLDPDDKRWAAIGYDCYKPTDDVAFQELIAMLPKRK